MKKLFYLGWMWCAAAAAHGAASPFAVTATAQQQDSQPVVQVALKIPAQHFIYAEHLKISAAGAQLVPLQPVAPKKIHDKFSDEDKLVYDTDLLLTYRVTPPAAQLEVQVELQGCNDALCFFPEKLAFSLAWAERPASPTAPPARTNKGLVAAPAQPLADWTAEADHFVVTATAAGYLDKEKFLAFLASGAGATAPDQPKDETVFSWSLVLLFLLGGLLLNLTPCVLPMIPVNLAIIGAGARAGAPRRGFLLGGTYGLGMALAYGALGLVVVLTGAKFGALNASPWFNAVIAVVFVVMALAMFDVIQVDLSRFQGSLGTPDAKRRGTFGLAFTMGIVAALLAGACVAPVVFSVLLLAGNLYAQGQPLGLLLPFVLGVGMALPWPLAGAGLSFLPKPGGWMTKVKYAFGVLILVLAGYYGYEAYGLFRPPAGGGNTSAAEFSRQLAAARAAGKPVFIDFWATWCKNCHAMDATTFQDADVQRHLAAFVVIKYQAEQPNEAPAKAVLDRYGAVGLPTYSVLRPKP
jgi:thiol:disulfide interchange protein